MREHGLDAMWFEPRFASNEKDEVWLPVAGREGWIVLTKDHEIRHNFPEINAIMEHRVKCFLLPKKLNGAGHIALVLATHEHIANICRERSGPLIYAVHLDGRMERRDSAQWLERWRQERARLGLPPLHR